MSSNGPALDFGYRLGLIRRARCWTLRDLSARSGISVSSLSALERCERQPTLGTLHRIATAFEISISTLLGDPAAEDWSVFDSDSLIARLYRLLYTDQLSPEARHRLRDTLELLAWFAASSTTTTESEVVHA